MQYTFVDCTLDTQLYVLWRAGTLCRLRPKVFQVLQYLMQHRHRVISKQELAEQLWPEQYICDAVVENTIMAVRRAMGDSGRAQRIIQTLSGYGYRFIAPVVELTASASREVLEATTSPGEPTELAAAVLPVTETLEREPPPTASCEPLSGGMSSSCRQLTVLCYDLVDLSALARQLDPDDLHEVMHAYHATCTAVVERFEGTPVQPCGAGRVAYFGYPLAHEDDAARAVHTALSLVEALDALNTSLEHELQVRLHTRLGIHTGLTVIADGVSAPLAPASPGETPAVAAQIQAVAPPDTVVISAATVRLVQNLFVCRSVEMPTGQDTALPQPLWQVLGRSDTQPHCAVIQQQRLRPLVGRAEEMRLLQHRWEQACHGQGHGVWLCGEAGIGKSHLLKAFRARLGAQGDTCRLLRCSPYARQSALYPVRMYLQQRLGWQHETPLATKRATLEELLRTCGVSVAEALPVFASLLALPLEPGAAPPALPPERQKRKLLELLTMWLLQEAEQQPALLIWEDVHWADPSSLELLSLCVDQLPTTAVLMLCTARPEWQPLWSARSYLTQLTLERLDPDQVAQMVTHATAGKALPPEVLQEVIARSDGVPLFVEELLKTMLESGLVREDAERYTLSGSWSSLTIPDTLQGLLLARLDRLGPAREVAQLGATLGRTFAYDMLCAIAPYDETTLQQGLARLVEAELLYQRGLPPRARYTFKHALIQEVAYQSILKQTRQHYHQQIAQVLEAQFPETAETRPELLAYHCTEAGLHAQAVSYWQRAGQRAFQQSAYVEAGSHLARGLEVCHTLPDTPERNRQACILHLGHARALTITNGYAAPEVGAAYDQAWELVRHEGESAEHFPALFGLWQFHVLRSDFRTADTLWEQLFNLAYHQQDPAFLLHAHRALGFTLVCRGEVVSAYRHLQQGLALYDPQAHRQHVLVSGQEPGLMCLTEAAQALWMLGYPTQALQRSTEALALARDLQRPYNLVCTLGWASWLHQHRREWWIVQEQAAAIVALATEHGFALWRAAGLVMWGWSLTMQGQGAQGMTQIQQGLTALEDTGTTLMRPYFLAMLAEAYGQVGQPEAGRTILTEAQAVAERHGERFHAAELYRLEGDLLLACSAEHAEAAEACFQRALACARSQHVKSLELRAAISLARLWQQQDKRTEAYDLLAPIYSWFTEGFDTASLKEAKGLLAELV